MTTQPASAAPNGEGRAGPGPPERETGMAQAFATRGAGGPKTEESRARPVRFASVDTTRRCPLRCRHCYYYRTSPSGEDVSDEDFLAGLATWKAATGAECMLWLGGEPFLRPDLVREGTRLFRRNGAFTSGSVPLPQGIPCGVVVSLDGTATVNDAIRGPGAFQRVMNTTDGGRGHLFHCTLTSANMGSTGELLARLHRADAAGVLFGFYSPRAGETGGWVLTDAERNAAVDLLLRLRKEYDGFLLNTAPSLELLRPGESMKLAARCPYRNGEAVALDHRLRVKHPCSYGPGADCLRCGCVAMSLRATAEDGDVAARSVLDALFVHR